MSGLPSLPSDVAAVPAAPAPAAPVASSASPNSLASMSDNDMMALAIKQGVVTPEKGMQMLSAKKQADRAPLADAIASGVADRSGVPQVIVKGMLTSGGKFGDIAAQALTPVLGALAGTAIEPGGGSVAGGIVGGAAGNTLSQLRQYLRGQRDDFSWGQFGVSTVLGGAGGALPEAVAASPLAMVGMRAAQSAGITVPTVAAGQLIDNGKIDWKDLAESGGLAAIFGGTVGGVESATARKAVLAAIRDTPEFKNFEGTDSELVDAVKTKLAKESATPEENVTGTAAPEGVPAVPALQETAAPPVPPAEQPVSAPTPMAVAVMAAPREPSITAVPAGALTESGDEAEHPKAVPAPSTLPPTPPTDSTGSEIPAGQPGFVTGIKNAAVDASRKAMGQEPITPSLSMAMGPAWDAASARAEADPTWTSSLVDRFAAGGAPNPVEVAGLAQERVTRMTALDTAANNLNVSTEAQESPEQVAAAQSELNRASDALQSVDVALRRAGTVQSNAFNARKIFATDDYQLANIDSQLRASFGGRPLTPQEQQWAVQVAKEHAQNESDLTTQQQVSADQNAQDNANQTAQQIIRQRSPSPSGDPVADQQVATQQLSDKLDSGDLDISREAQKLAKTFVQQGITDRDALIDKVHGELTMQLPGLTRRDTMDAISGYGDFKALTKDDVSVKLRDLKGQMQQVAKLQDMVAQGQMAKKTGIERRTPSDTERSLAKRVNEAKKVLDFQGQVSAGKLSSAQQALKTRLTNQIADLDRQIASGSKDIPSGTALTPNAENQALIARRNALKKTFDEKFPKPELTPEQREAATSGALDRQISELERQLRTDEVFPAGKSEPTTSAAIEAKRAQIDKLKEERDYARERIQTPEDPPTQLERLQTRIQKRIDDLQKRIDTKDFSPRTKPRTPVTMDPKAMALEQKQNELELIYRSQLEKNRLQQREWLEKGADGLVGWARNFKLMSPTVFPKLLESGMSIILLDPVSRLAAQPLRAIPGFAAKAPYYMGMSVKAEAKAIAGAILSATPAFQKLTRGFTHIDTAIGKMPQAAEMRNFIGNIHGMIKEPFRQAIYAKSLQLRLEASLKAGINPREPSVQTGIISAAAQDANRGIYAGDNLINKFMYRMVIHALTSQGIEGKALADAIQILLPIVNIPTNIAIAQGRHAVGIPEAFIRLAAAYKQGQFKNGSAKLSEDDARKIAMALGTGIIGLVVAADAWEHPDNYGGLYLEDKLPGMHHTQPLKTMEWKVLGHTVPAWMNHFPTLLWAQSVASARRIYDRYYTKGDAIINALGFALMAPVTGMPLIDEVLRAFDSTKTPGQIAGALIAGSTPLAPMRSVLNLTDSQRRSPKTFADEFRMGIPGMRNQVPVSGGPQNGPMAAPALPANRLRVPR